MPQGAAISREEKKVENKEVRILVVDDEPTMSDSLRQNFVEEGYSVDTAATGIPEPSNASTAVRTSE